MAERPGTPEPPGEGALRVGRFRVAALYEREAFVYRIEDTRWEADFYNVFIRPPGALLRQVAGDWLDAAGLFQAVLGSTDPAPVDWILEARVHRLYADLRTSPEVRIDVGFTLLDAKSIRLDMAFRGEYDSTVAAAGAEPEQLLEAWNEAYAVVLTELEADLRSFLTEREEQVEPEANASSGS
jgi:hypothetical protein